MDACLAPGEYMGETLAHRQFGGFLATECTFSPDAVLPLHAHQAATICFVLRGSFNERYEGKTAEAEGGMVLYRPKGHTHSDRFYGPKHRTLGIDLLDESILPEHPVSFRHPK